jgi:hypothetical protein
VADTLSPRGIASDFFENSPIFTPARGSICLPSGASAWAVDRPRYRRRQSRALYPMEIFEPLIFNVDRIHLVILCANMTQGRIVIWKL